MDSKIVLVTGEIASGKSTLSRRIVSALQERGADVAGVLSLPQVENGVKTGILLENARTREQRLLATAAKIGEGTAGLSWRFDPTALAAGGEIIRSAVPCDVLVVDELGPLELVRGEGWACAVDILTQRQYRVALAVVRPALVSAFRSRMGEIPIETVVVTRSEQDSLFERLTGEIGP